MNALEALRNKVQNLNLVQMAEVAINSFDKEITDLVRVQLSEGRKGDNTLMTKYSRNTIKSKSERGTILMGERIALIDTGDFWNSFLSQARSGKLFVSATDWKTDELISRYGKSIFDLDNESQIKLKELLYKPISENLYNTLK